MRGVLIHPPGSECSTHSVTSPQGAFDHAEAQREGKIIPHRGVDAEYDEALERLDATKRSLADYLKEQCKYFGTKVGVGG